SVSSEEKLQNLAYMMGQNAFDISLEIARRKFPSLSFPTNSGLEAFLYNLTFNSKIGKELTEEYKVILKSKLKRGEIKEGFEDYFSEKTVLLGFKKQLYKAPAPRDIGK